MNKQTDKKSHLRASGRIKVDPELDKIELNRKPSPKLEEVKMILSKLKRTKRAQDLQSHTS